MVHCPVCREPIPDGVRIGCFQICDGCAPQVQELLDESVLGGHAIDIQSACYEVYNRSYLKRSTPLLSIPLQLRSRLELRAEMDNCTVEETILRALVEYCSPIGVEMEV